MDYFITRCGNSRQDMHKLELIWALLASLSCYDIYQKSHDYSVVYLFLISSLFLGLEEVFLVVSGIRRGTIAKNFVILQALLRGIAEGGAFVMYTMPFFSWWNISSFIMLFRITHKASIPPCTLYSLRHLFNLPSVAFITMTTLLNIGAYLYYPYLNVEDTFVRLSIICTLWNSYAYWRGIRFIANGQGVINSNYLVQFLGLSYDSIFEMAGVYTAFVVVAKLFYLS